MGEKQADEGTYRYTSDKNDGHLVYQNAKKKKFMYFMADTQVWAVSAQVGSISTLSLPSRLIAKYGTGGSYTIRHGQRGRSR